jgi:hypothetical protein
MPRFFNIAGPCHQSDHYMLDPLRYIGKELMDLIDSKQYFVIHAARQSGKTTLLLELTDKINAEGCYHALYCSLEAIQGINEPEKGISDGLIQLSAYIDRCGAKEGWLVVFDRSSKKPWEDKLYMRSEMHEGRHITVVGA